MLLSPHNPRVLYFAGNHVFRSNDRGDTWRVISPDLTRGRPGPSPHTGHTISALAESPVKARTDTPRFRLDITLKNRTFA